MWPCRLKRCGLSRGLREIRTTHQDLAAQVGSNRENVSRVLGLLRDQGLLRLGRGSIEILDHQALAGPVFEGGWVGPRFRAGGPESWGGSASIVRCVPAGTEAQRTSP